MQSDGIKATKLKHRKDGDQSEIACRLLTVRFEQTVWPFSGHEVRYVLSEVWIDDDFAIPRVVLQIGFDDHEKFILKLVYPAVGEPDNFLF